MRPLILANPAAGSGRARLRLQALQPALQTWPEPPLVRWTEGPGHAVALAAAARAEGRELVIAAGGDGTAHEVVNGLLQAHSGPVVPVFSVLPVGTASDFARALGISSMRSKVCGLPAWSQRLVDVGRIEFRGPPSQTIHFLNAVNVGLGPAVAARVSNSPWLRWMGKCAYTVGTAIEILTSQPSRLGGTVDGAKLLPATSINLSVCNGPFFGGGMCPCPEATLDSGRFEVLRIRWLPRTIALLQLRRFFQGGGINHPGADHFVCRCIELEGSPLLLEVDGQLLTRLPVRISVRPGALRVLGPG